MFVCDQENLKGKKRKKKTKKKGKDTVRVSVARPQSKGKKSHTKRGGRRKSDSERGRPRQDGLLLRSKDPRQRNGKRKKKERIPLSPETRKDKKKGGTTPGRTPSPQGGEKKKKERTAGPATAPKESRIDPCP